MLISAQTAEEEREKTIYVTLSADARPIVKCSAISAAQTSSDLGRKVSQVR